MIKIFFSKHQEYNQVERVNIVDEQNNLIGFCCLNACCEEFGILINGEIIYANVDLDGNYHREYLDSDGNEIQATVILGGNLVREEQTNYLESEPFYSRYGDDVMKECSVVTSKGDIITLFNAHNGYYAHDVTMKLNGKDIVKVL